MIPTPDDIRKAADACVPSFAWVMAHEHLRIILKGRTIEIEGRAAYDAPWHSKHYGFAWQGGEVTISDIEDVCRRFVEGQAWTSLK